MTAAKANPTFNFERLTQQQAAKMIGKPAIWLRDNSDLAGRNEDGSYDSVKLIAALLKRCDVATVSDCDLEKLRIVTENAAVECAHLPAVVKLLDGIAETFGPAGLAAIGAEILASFRHFTVVRSAVFNHSLEVKNQLD